MSTQPKNQSIFTVAPPLRLILLTECKGECTYCHHEGLETACEHMPEILIENCAEAAETLALPEIALTGGEPTIISELDEIISKLQEVYHGNVSLTTNGYKLSSCHIVKPIHKLNLSISSFSKDVYEKYQKVNPYIAIESALVFPATHKCVNVVVTEDNYNEIQDVLTQCLKRGLSVDVMFELRKFSESELSRHRYILSIVEQYGRSYIHLGTTSTIVVIVSNDLRIRIKHPKLSKLTRWDICKSCENDTNCYEGLCAVRVYPNGLVTTCLSQEYHYIDGSIENRISEAYKSLAQSNSILSSLI